jgi:DNA-binding NtrC family response regulator
VATGPAEAPAAPEAAAAPPAAALPPLRDVVEKAERDHIVRALAAAGGNKRRAIELLGISSETFYRRLDDFGLRKKRP